jgi:hypothetical protein
MRTAMDLEERLQQWLDEHGFQGSVAFNFFSFLRLVFWSLVASGLVLAIQR